ASLASLSNDALVEAASAHPTEFSVLIALPMQDAAAAVAEVEQWAPNRLVRGVMVDSNIAGRDFAEPAFAPIWAAIEAVDLAVLVHPYQGDVVGMDRLRKHYLFNLIGNPVDTTIAIANVVFGGLADLYPKLRWGFVHGGGIAPYLAGRWDHGWHQRSVTRELIPDALPSEILRRFWYDCIVHDTRTLSYLAEGVGWDRIMLGSDCPFDMGYTDPVNFVDQVADAQEHRDAVLLTNANDFLRSP
ncbi:MAG: aminocarboxymuconate-semialdehyde decarboxylase, partial [Verrucomicrobiales bacterium]